MSQEPHKKDLVLAVNSGSSSLKISLYRLVPSFDPSSSSPASLPLGKEPVELLLVSTISNLSAPPASLSWKPSPHSTPTIDFGELIKDAKVDKVDSHTTAFTYFLEHLQNASGLNEDSIGKVCHRVVHGGDYVDPVVIDAESYEHIERLSDLAPLHNGAALTLIKATLEHVPNATSIAYFDTAFHKTIPPHISNYAIDPVIAKKRGLKKYGFHGLSYAYILRTLTTCLSPPPSRHGLNLIILHLGSGASAVCIKDGKSFDTTMGLTPVSGLPGATRSGDVDPSLVFHWFGSEQAAQEQEAKKAEKDGDEYDEDDQDGLIDVGRLSHQKTAGVDIRVTIAEEILNKRSGWKAITGTTNFGVIVSKMKEAKQDDVDNPFKMAFDLLLDRLLTYIGSFYLKLGGNIDALVFAGGIGEKSIELREAIGKKVECLGFNIDLERNNNVGNIQAGLGEDKMAVEISVENDKKKVFVVWTDEQLEMAKECAFEPKFWQ
ncbi:hypothetical protein QCA50_005733 [Cerrena zonata]|uniref:Probable acetate kinase n=1 Tax=Cerrena zonata TaxID=2478898 RepID=A0AAW0GHH9_9APHY